MNDPDRSVLKVTRSVQIDAPADRVWREFTSAERLTVWWPAVQVFQPKAGGRIELAISVGSVARVIGGEIAIFAHLRDLTFAADFIPPGEWAAPTAITVRLISAHRGTLVELIHHGFERVGGDGEATRAKFERVWTDTELQALKGIVEA